MNKRRAKAIAYLIAAQELQTALDSGIADVIAFTEGGDAKDTKRIEKAMTEISQSLHKRGERMSR